VIIDIFPHIFTKKYAAGVRAKLLSGPGSEGLKDFIDENIGMSDFQTRLAIMNKLPEVVQVLNIHAPGLEMMVTPADAVELARTANDEMAELVAKYPTRFIAAVAHLPMNDLPASLKEAQRAIEKLKFKGIQIFSHVNGEKLDSARLEPLWELMAGYDLPIWVHPYNPPGFGHPVFHAFSWPYQTSLAMLQIIRAGVFQRYPLIKFITHHCGGMIPFHYLRVSEVPKETFRKFYADTAVLGNTSALMCGYDYFGPEHILFGTDMRISLDTEKTQRTIRSVENMTIPKEDKEKILAGNARRLLKLE
jgi:predicted TIM-barrel fold metal-dependent hydrolase